jgi:hypothetical protein
MIRFALETILEAAALAVFLAAILAIAIGVN